ncbi:MAG: ParA family protein [Gammaproteobacteria bacterium]
MLRIISVYNIKGGVAKTTTAVNLAYLASSEGARTLLWDLDPQGASTYTLRCEPNVEGGARELVDGEKPLWALTRETDYRKLDLIPSDFSYRHMDTMIDEYKEATKHLLRLMRPLRDEYDYLIIDCPPGMTLVSENIVRASDAIVTPILPSPFSIQMLNTLMHFIEEKNWDDVSILPFFSMVDRRKNLHKQVTESLRDDYPMILQTEIPYSSEIEQMSLRRAPIPSYSPKSRAGRAFTALWAEIQREMLGESEFDSYQRIAV